MAEAIQRKGAAVTDGRAPRLLWDDNVFTQEEKDRPFLAALRTTVALGPGIAVLVTTAAYAGFNLDAFPAVIAGLVAAVLTWLTAATCALCCVNPSSADSVNYRHIREKYQRLVNRLGCVCPNVTKKPTGNGKDIERHIVCQQVWRECRTIEAGLDREKRGMPWAIGMGYVELWRRIHRAEEALIKVQPLDEVLGGAMRDEARLTGSNMTNKKTLLKRLRRAVSVLDRTDKELSYLEESEVPKEPVEHKQTNEELCKKAINILSEIRYQINYFRDQGAEGIILARNRLSGTSAAVGVATYILLALAIVAGAPSAPTHKFL